MERGECPTTGDVAANNEDETHECIVAQTSEQTIDDDANEATELNTAITQQQTSGAQQQQQTSGAQQQQQMSDTQQRQTSGAQQQQMSDAQQQQMSEAQQRQTSGAQQQQTSGAQQQQQMSYALQQQKSGAQQQLANDRELLQRELELVRREKEVLRRENDLLKMGVEKYRRQDKKVKEYINDTNGNENVKNVNNDKNTTPFSLLKELLPEYDGTTCPQVWITQFKNIAQMYDLDDNNLKALLMMKMKAKAQIWLYSKANHIHEDREELLAEMLEMFGSKENKLAMRRTFEAFKWHSGKSFAEYYTQKVFLADKIGVTDEELIDYLIDGIPDENYKIHANLQCYKNKTQLLQAFSKLQLKEPETTTRIHKKEVQVRCYKCNSLGHLAANCRKPKREVGACYVCAERGHFAATCPKRQQKLVHAVIPDGDQDEYEH